MLLLEEVSYSVGVLGARQVQFAHPPADLLCRCDRFFAYLGQGLSCALVEPLLEYKSVLGPHVGVFVFKVRSCYVRRPFFGFFCMTRSVTGPFLQLALCFMDLLYYNTSSAFVLLRYGLFKRVTVLMTPTSGGQIINFNDVSTGLF